MDQPDSIGAAAKAGKRPASNDFSYMSAYERAELIRRRKASSVEIMEPCLGRIEALGF